MEHRPSYQATNQSINWWMRVGRNAYRAKRFDAAGPVYNQKMNIKKQKGKSETWSDSLDLTQTQLFYLWREEFKGEEFIATGHVMLDPINQGHVYDRAVLPIECGHGGGRLQDGILLRRGTFRQDWQMAAAIRRGNILLSFWHFRLSHNEDFSIPKKNIRSFFPRKIASARIPGWRGEKPRAWPGTQWRLGELKHSNSPLLLRATLQTNYTHAYQYVGRTVWIIVDCRSAY